MQLKKAAGPWFRLDNCAQLQHIGLSCSLNLHCECVLCGWVVRTLVIRLQWCICAFVRLLVRSCACSCVHVSVRVYVCRWVGACVRALVRAAHRSIHTHFTGAATLAVPTSRKFSHKHEVHLACGIRKTNISKTIIEEENQNSS